MSGCTTIKLTLKPQKVSIKLTICTGEEIVYEEILRWVLIGW